jgi:GNAT superfamily N-acetyltransferase
MFVRLALESDIPRLRELGIAHAAETWPDRVWSEERAAKTFERYITTANPTIFVVESDRQVVGYLHALIVDCSFTTSSSVFLDVIYVEPVKRGTRAAAMLMQEFFAFIERISPDEVLTQDVENPVMARFLRLFGFEPAGYNYRYAPRGAHEKTEG